MSCWPRYRRASSTASQESTASSMTSAANRRQPSSGSRSAPLTHRIAFFAPAAHAAVHGKDVLVTHLLEVVGRQGRTKTAATIENDLRLPVRHALFDVPLEDTSAKVRSAGYVVLGPFALFAHVDQLEFLTAIELG